VNVIERVVPPIATQYNGSREEMRPYYLDPEAPTAHLADLT
jgi:hypothetical protein